MADAERMTFVEALREQRWDDHRFYHHSRINQSLHLLSALCFLTAYVLIWFEPVVAVLLAWIVAMVPRQVGHFFFEPKSYDEVNQATHDYKESVKVGYNLKRKVLLLSVWAIAPLMLWLEPSLFGLVTPHGSGNDYLHNLCMVWLGVAFGAIIVRSVHLFFIKDVQAGLVWATKILTDPFHDVKLYWRAPFHVLKGDLYDYMEDDWSGQPAR